MSFEAIFQSIIVRLTHLDPFSPCRKPHLFWAAHTPDLLTEGLGFISEGALGPRWLGLCRQL